MSGRVLMRFLVVSGVLSAIFAGYSLAQYLSRAASGLVKPEFVLRLVALKTLIATEIVVPIALYAAVLFGVESLRRHEETTALQAVGFGPRQAANALAPLFLSVAILVAILSLWVRPKAYAASYDIRLVAEAAFDLLDIEPGRFYDDSEGNWVAFAGGKRPDGTMEG
ncbi:MAG: LptF/LptG family permease, partial [Planctomycetes bacterium]|nr:LptF/LptG family permease [Planctomycetota bacterium]